jgi:hypothetical protein
MILTPQKASLVTLLAIVSLTIESCTPTAMVSANHFQDASSLESGEFRYLLAAEQALTFQLIAEPNT